MKDERWRDLEPHLDRLLDLSVSERAAELALLLRRKPTTRSQQLLREWKLGQAWKTPLPKLLSVRKARTQRRTDRAGAGPEAD